MKKKARLIIEHLPSGGKWIGKSENLTIKEIEKVKEGLEDAKFTSMTVETDDNKIHIFKPNVIKDCLVTIDIIE